MEVADYIVNKIVKFRQIWGVHIFENKSRDLEIFAVLLEKKKGVIKIIENKSFSSFEGLKDVCDQNIPIGLSYQSKKILNKIADNADNATIEAIIHGANLNDFYVQTTKCDVGYNLSLIRKVHFDNILSFFKENNAGLVSVVFGPVNVGVLTAFLDENTLQKDINVTGSRITFANGYVKEIIDTDEFKDENLRIGYNTIERDRIIPYSNALILLVSDDLPPYIDKTDFPKLSVENKYKKFFTKTFYPAIVSCFMVLLVNFFLLRYLNSVNNDLSGEFGQYRSKLERLNEMKKAVDYKEKVISELGVSNNKLLSFYSDRLASTLDENIKLTSLDIYPQKGNKRGISNDFDFEKDKIKIKGFCSSPSDLNRWLIGLRDEKYVKEVSNQEYDYDDFNNKARFYFELKVKQP